LTSATAIGSKPEPLAIEGFTPPEKEITAADWNPPEPVAR
jgi:hypothetical protein